MGKAPSGGGRVCDLLPCPALKKVTLWYHLKEPQLLQLLLNLVAWNRWVVSEGKEPSELLGDFWKVKQEDVGGKNFLLPV